MQGFPKTLNTKEDYEYIRAHFTPEEWKPHFQALIDESKDWFFVEYLPIGKEGIVDETHQVIEERGMDSSEQTRYMQYEFRLNPTCKMLRIGYTEEEVRKILDEA